MKKYELQPMTLAEANAFVEQYHRHHGKVQGHKFSIAINDGNDVIGVAIIGRPVARMLDNGLTLEVTRLCVKNGFKDACSMLYSAAWRATRALGYKRLITYILKSNLLLLKVAGSIASSQIKPFLRRRLIKFSPFLIRLNLQLKSPKRLMISPLRKRKLETTPSLST